MSFLRVAGIAGTGAVALVSAAVAVFAATHAAVDVATLGGPIHLLDIMVGVTPLAVPFCAILAILDLAAALWSVRRGRALDATLIAAFSAAMLLVLCARSVALFFFAWEAMALISVFLVLAHDEKRDVRRAAQLYLIFSQCGAACVGTALVLLAVHAGSPSFTTIARAPALPSPMQWAILTLALIGFGSKAGLVPFHVWLPRAHPVAPAHASALLSGVMLKVAIFGLATVTLQLAAPVPGTFAIALIVLGTISAVVGVLYALVDRDLKRVLAYSSVENIGVITLGLGASLLAADQRTTTTATLLLAATLFHAANHGLFKGLLFLGAGAVSDSEGTVDLERLGGVARHLVWTAPAFFVGCVAVAALPPLNGFASEWLIFRGLAAELHGVAAATRFTALGAIAGLALSGGLAAACFARAYGIAFLGEPRHPRVTAASRERFDTSALALTVLAALCVFAGLLPSVALAPIQHVAAVTFGSSMEPIPALPLLPIAVALLPIAGALGALALATRRRVRSVPTWTCGSPVTAAMQYTATAFSKPLRIIFAFVLLPERTRVEHGNGSQWFAKRVVYRTSTRYLIDEVARRLGSIMLRAARRSQRTQSGSLRLYLAYAMAAVIVAVAVAR